VSTEDLPERKDRPTVLPLKQLSLDEMVKETKVCSHCGEVQIYGNIANIRICYSYFELCEACLRSLSRGCGRALARLPILPSHKKEFSGPYDRLRQQLKKKLEQKKRIEKNKEEEDENDPWS